MADDRLLTMRQIGEILQGRFFVRQKIETLRVLFPRFGIAPFYRGLDPDSGRGSTGYYDPLAVWVMATYFHWPLLCAVDPDSAMSACRSRAKTARAGVDNEETRRLACYLFISDAAWGMDLRVLDTALTSDPTLLKLTLDGEQTLERVLRAYKQAVVKASVPDYDGAVKLGTGLSPTYWEDVPVDLDMPRTWPFFAVDSHKIYRAMFLAGLYDPAVDHSFLGKMRQTDWNCPPELSARLGLDDGE